MSSLKRTSLGRQKIAIAKIHNKNRLQVTFSKRRTGLFKKASELCTLCGVEIAILVFSPTNKVFSFGHPDVNSIIDRFIGSSSDSKSAVLKMLESYSRNDNIRHLNMMLAQLYGQLEEERDRGKNLDDMIKARQPPIDNNDYVNHLEMCLEELKKKVIVAKTRMMDHSFLPQLHNPNPTPPAAADHSLPMQLPPPPPKPTTTMAKHDIDTVGNNSHLINFPPENSFVASL